MTPEDCLYVAPKTALDFHKAIGFVENKYGFQHRDFGGKFTGPTIREDLEYLDFWHWVLREVGYPRIVCTKGGSLASVLGGVVKMILLVMVEPAFLFATSAGLAYGADEAPGYALTFVLGALACVFGVAGVMLLAFNAAQYLESK